MPRSKAKFLFDSYPAGRLYSEQTAAVVKNLYSRPITKPELAEHLSVKTRTIDRWMASRVIPFVKVGHVVRFNLAAVERTLEKKYTIHEASL